MAASRQVQTFAKDAGTTFITGPGLSLDRGRHHSGIGPIRGPTPHDDGQLKLICIDRANLMVSTRFVTPAACRIEATSFPNP